MSMTEDNKFEALGDFICNILTGEVYHSHGYERMPNGDLRKTKCPTCGTNYEVGSPRPIWDWKPPLTKAEAEDYLSRIDASTKTMTRIKAPPD
jgi:uncharacterized Zn-finger protein